MLSMPALQEPAQTPSTWPAPFVDARASADTPWTDSVVEAEGVEVRVAYPAGWSVDKNPSGDPLLSMHNATGVRGITVRRPVTLPAALPQPVPASAVQEFGNVAREGYAKSDGAGKSQGYGQGLLADRWWMWVDLQFAILPPQIVQASKDAFAGTRMWIFVTPVGTRIVSVACYVLLPRGLPAVETDDLIKQSGVESQALLKRVSVRSRP
jgi:hypothetical protein